jgi:FixJ family two-component response regulator
VVPAFELLAPLSPARFLKDYGSQLLVGLAHGPTTGTVTISGYTDDAVVRDAVLNEQVHFLPKPLSTAVLAQKVRDVLDSPPS